jgi:hypothetical protein
MSLLGNAIKQCTQLESAFDNQVLYDGIISCLSPATRITLARACTSTYTAVDEFTRRVYNINRHLGQYFTKPTAFRTLQAQTGTLISGSSAIQFLDRSQYPGSDLDLYVNPGHGREVGQWLIEREGYTFKPTGSQDENNFEAAIKCDDEAIPDDPHAHQETYGTKSIRSVFTFQKLMPDNKELTVQMMLTVFSAFHAISEFHSSEQTSL